MPQIIQGGINAAALAGVDDAYVLLNPPNAVQLPGASTNVAGVVGSASWGPTNTPIVIGSGADLVSNFGPPTTAAFDMPTDINIMLQLGANNLRAVRVADGSDTAPLLKIVDATGFASDTLTVGGTFAAGVPLSATLTPVSGSAVTVPYTTQSSDTNLAGIAASLVGAINASAAVVGPTAFLQAATNTGALVTLQALVQGTSQNTIGLTATGTGVTLTAGGATFTGGLAPGVLATLTGKYTGSYINGAQAYPSQGSASTTTSPTTKVTLTYPNAVPEVFDNIISYATPGGGYSGATFAANLVKAINASPQLNPLRGASAFWVATAGASTASPLLGVATPVTTLGTDGSTFASGATAAQLGNDTAVPKTGMYALSGAIAGGQFCLSGNTDLTNASAAAIAFAARENAHVVLAFPKGTSTQSAIATKQLLGLSSSSATVLKDWAEFTDSVNNISPRSISPAAFALGRIAITSPETSPANLRVPLMTGTERTGATQNVPYSPGELALLESNGINLFTNNSPGGRYFAIRHNKNSNTADPSRANIAYSTMSKFLAFNRASTLIGQFVGQTQSTKPNDPTREKIRAAYNDYAQRLVSSGLLDSSTTICDLRNNPVPQIQAGVLRVDCVDVYMSVIDRIVVTQSGGQTTSIQVLPQSLSANS